MRKNKLFVTSPIVASILIALLFLSLSLFTGATNLFGLNGSAYADYTISMTSSGAQSINVSPDASGVGTSISVDAVTVTTTCPAGYNLTTTTSVSDNKLYLNGSSSNNASGTYFSPSDGTTALSNAANTWGFYQDGSTVPTASSVFKAVPASGSSAATIRTGSSSGTDSFNIYYGVAVGNNLAPGTYKMISDTNDPNNNNGTVRYYLTMNESCIPYLVVFNANGGSGTMNDQQIYKNVTTPLNANTYFAPSGKEFKEWNTKSDGTGISYQDQQPVTNLTTPGNSITLYAIWRVPPTPLYNLVATQSKGTQTVADLRTAIDANNSGVYEYDSSVFGTASDAANTSKIYYYRGILDNTTGSYGSNGDNAAWPNTVLLDTTGNGKDTSDTCWRIVRTTGSGGVKMIFQGKWTGSTCANAQDNAQVTTQAFGLKGNSSQSTYWYRNINRVGYTFNNDASIQDITTRTSVDTVFGSDSSPSTNNERSNIKKYIEDTWYASNMTSYTSKLEASAGYCNDRTAYSDNTTSTSLSTIPPYATSSASMYFGAYGRNANATNAGKKPSLTCPRSTVDLYRYVSGSTGVSNQLKYPAALLTADEVSFAGSGRSPASQGSAYHAKSFLRSGSYFWFLSPYSRSSSGYAYGFDLYSYLNSRSVSDTIGVRPSISLTSGTTAASGTGTAVDPWIVNP